MKSYNILIFTILIAVFSSCKSHLPFFVNEVKPYTNQSINSSLSSDSAYIKEIMPYKEKMDAEMSIPLSYAEVDFTKDGYSSNEGNLLADLMLSFSQKYAKKNGLPIPDFCLLNKGGVRAIIPKGTVTLRNVFEVAPFENELVFVQLNGEQMNEMFNYLFVEKVGHPLAGIKISYKNNQLNFAQINNISFDSERKYWVATIDYLMTGGDRMYFFTKSENTVIPNIKFRDLLIEEIKQYKVLPNNTEDRLIFKN